MGGAARWGTVLSRVVSGGWQSCGMVGARGGTWRRWVAKHQGQWCGWRSGTAGCRLPEAVEVGEGAGRGLVVVVDGIGDVERGPLGGGGWTVAM